MTARQNVSHEIPTYNNGSKEGTQDIAQMSWLYTQGSSEVVTKDNFKAEPDYKNGKPFFK